MFTIVIVAIVILAILAMGVTETASQSRPRADLLGAYYKFDPKERGLIARQVAPPLAVGKRFGQYGVMDRATWLQRINTKRAPKAKTSESGFSIGADTFSLVEYAHKVFCDEVEADMYADWVSFEEIAAEIAAGVVEMDLEYDVAALVFNETTFVPSGETGATLSGGSEWSNKTGGLPIDDIERAKEKVKTLFGVEANTVVFSRKNHKNLSLNTQMRSTMTQLYGRVLPGRMPIETFQAIFGIDNILVAGGVYDAANPGQSTASLTNFWSDEYCWVGRVESGSDLKRPQSFRTLELANQQGVQIDSWDIPDPKGNYVRARAHMSAHDVPDPVGYLIKNVD